MADIVDYEFGISAIDSGFLRPHYDAVHLIVESGRAALVDTAHNDAVPRVLEALAAKELGPEDVDFVIVTHIHLDHAGGAGLLMRHLPNARLAVHPRGARHMADPARLVASTIEVYGEAAARRMYGEVVPVDPSRIIQTQDGTILRLNGRELLFVDTPGHAPHHQCIVDRKSGHAFTGDTYGVCYRQLGTEDRQFVWPVTPPSQFDPEALHRSIDRVASHGPGAIYLTHFGQLRDVPRLASDLHRLIDAHVEVGRRAVAAGVDRHERMVADLRRVALTEAERYHWPVSSEQVLQVLSHEFDLNAKGVALWLDRVTPKRSG